MTAKKKGSKSRTLTKTDLAILSAPFPDDSLGIKLQHLSPDKTQALLVQYLQHTDVQARLEKVDPAWTCEVLSEETRGRDVFVRTRMVLKGVSRENVGEGADPKSAYSDALKRCAMLFGVGRYLYDSSKAWVPYNEKKDRSRVWTLADYVRGLKADAPVVAESSADKKPSPVASKPSSKPDPKPDPRQAIHKLLMELYSEFTAKFPETSLTGLLDSRYGVQATREMTVQQLEDLAKYMALSVNEGKGPRTKIQPLKRGPLVTQAQVKRLYTIAKGNEWSEEDIKLYIHNCFGLDSSKELNRIEYDLLVSIVEKSKAAVALRELKSYAPKGPSAPAKERESESR